MIALLINSVWCAEEFDLAWSMESGEHMPDKVATAPISQAA